MDNRPCALNRRKWFNAEWEIQGINRVVPRSFARCFLPFANYVRQVGGGKIRFSGHAK